MKNVNELLNTLPGANEKTLLAKIGRASLKTGIFLAKWKPVLGIGLNLAILMLIYSCPALAQTTGNPWGGSGTTKLSNAGGNILILLTWIAFVIGIGSFIAIPIFMRMEKPYSSLIASGIIGVGGFAVIGSIAYDVVNLNSITLANPTVTGR